MSAQSRDSDSRLRLARAHRSAIVLFLTTMTAAASAEIRFDRAAIFEIGPEPTAVALGDIDGDGVQDIFALSREDNRLALFLGRVDATTRDWFGTPMSESTGRGHETGGGYGGSPSGPGGGRPGGRPGGDGLPGFPTEASPVDIALADLNHDGIPDVMIAERDALSIGVRTGLRSGMLSPRTGFELSDRPIRLHVADVDDDGLDDLVIVCAHSVIVAHGSRKALLARFEALPVSILGMIVGSDLADVDGDGHVDVALLSYEAGRPDLLTVAYGNGSGSFYAEYLGEFDSRLAGANDLGMVDLNRDGVPELIAASSDSGLYVRDALSTGARLFPAHGGSSSITSSDFDDDGFPDLLTASCAGAFNSFNVHIADGRGGLESPIRFQAGGALARLALGDLDGDRSVDVVLPTAGASAGEPGSFDLFFDRSRSSLGAGSVNAGAGTIVDVLFVNESMGGNERLITLPRGASLSVYVDSPPAARAASPFALFAWAAMPTRGSGFEQPFGIGKTALPTPLSGGSPQPVFGWNGTGRAAFDMPGVSSAPAPREVLNRAAGVARPITIYLQGIIADPASAGDKRASVTNGILIDVR